MDIDTEQTVVCGAHIAVRHTTLAVLDLRGHVLASERIPHQAGQDPGRRYWARTRHRAVPPVLAGTGRRVLGLGIATGGWVDSVAGVVAGHPLLGWHNVHVRDQLEQLTGLPVRVDGHARAMVRAEELFGDRRARSSAVHLFAGNVVDARLSRSAGRSSTWTAVRVRVGRSPARTRPDRPVRVRQGGLPAGGRLRPRTLAAQAGLKLGREPARRRRALAAICKRARRPCSGAGRGRSARAAAATLLGMLNPGVLIVAEARRHHPARLPRRAARRSRGRPLATARRFAGAAGDLASSFGRDVLAVAAGTVMLAEIYADPVSI